MADPTDAAHLIRAKVTMGRLPRATNGSMKSWAGHGSGRLCDGCDTPIPPLDVEHEVDLVGLATLRFHRSCVAFWIAASRRTGGAEIAGGSSLSPWAVVFDLAIAGEMRRDLGACGELLAAGLEARGAAARTRERSQSIRARSLLLKAQSRRLAEGLSAN